MAAANSLGPPFLKDDPTIRAMFLQPFAAKLAQLGKDFTVVFREHGLHEYYLREPYERLPLRRFVALLEDIAQKSDAPCLGVELAQSFRSADLGPFNAMLTSAETLRAALECFVRFYSSWQTGTDVEIRQEDGITTINYRIRSEDIWPRVQDSEYFVSSIVSLIRNLGTSSWSPILVGLEHSLGLVKAFPDLSILVGSEPHIATVMRAGGAGSVNGMSNVAPHLLRRVISAPQNVSPADEKLIVDLIRLMTVLPDMPFVSCYKTGLAEQTGDDTWLNVRAPLSKLEAHEEKAVREVYRGTNQQFDTI